MHLKICTFKENGKFYAESEVTHANDIPLHDEAFKKFVLDNCPSTMADGFVLVMDLPDGEGFHTHLFRYNEL